MPRGDFRAQRTTRNLAICAPLTSIPRVTVINGSPTTCGPWSAPPWRDVSFMLGNNRYRIVYSTSTRAQIQRKRTHVLSLSLCYHPCYCVNFNAPMLAFKCTCAYASALIRQSHLHGQGGILAERLSFSFSFSASKLIANRLVDGCVFVQRAV